MNKKKIWLDSLNFSVVVVVGATFITNTLKKPIFFGEKGAKGKSLRNFQTGLCLFWEFFSRKFEV